MMSVNIHPTQKERRQSKNLKLFTVTLISLIILISSNVYAQTGRVLGKVIDSESGEGLIGANVFFEGTTIGAGTDLDGAFIMMDVPAGEYTLNVQMIGYAVYKFTGLQVKGGEITKLEVVLKPEALTTDEVVIEARMLKNNEASLLRARQKSVAVSDAISAEAISRTGSGDAAEAMKKVTGASVVDGKYVFVRGLGERYSSTQLNGAELPSSDPDKKAFQLDLLPSNLLENIVTIKTFTPDRSGNFTGGLVDVGTKTFPDQLTIKLSTSAKFNTNASFNNDFLTYNGGNQDWLGFDDGSRELPDVVKDPDLKTPLSVEARFDSEKAKVLDDVSNGFNSTMDVKRESVPVNQGLSFSIGNRVQLNEGSAIGYLGSFTYGRSFSFYENGKIGRYTLNDGATDMNPELLLSDSKGTSEANLGALANISYNITPSHQVGFNVLYTHSGISSARFQEGTWPHQFGYEDDTHRMFGRVLTYMERDIRSFQLNGEHNFNKLAGLNMDWSASVAQTTQDEPDRRLLATFERYLPNQPTSYVISGSNFDDPSRYYRYLEDQNNTFNLNFSMPFKQWSGHSSKFKFGGTYQTITRDFTERIFTYTVNNKIYNDSGGDVFGLFQPENMGITQIDTLNNDRFRYTFGNTIFDNSKDKNNYQGDQSVQAYYGMVELPVTRRMKFIGGLRYETTDIEAFSEDVQQDSAKIDIKDYLPSFNLIYELREGMNLRLAATQTLARPTFRELVPYSTKDFVNGEEISGNPGLKRTLIKNFDLRWEWFTRPGELLAISGFYKDLRDPIEKSFVAVSSAQNVILTFTNVGKASILGAEFEARLGLDHFYAKFRNFSFGGNLSVIKSTVDIPDAELSKRRAIDPDAKDTRVLQGQSDYILNLDLTYRNNFGTTASVNFNTFGERLSKVSSNITPDVYEQPIAQLDFIASQKLTSGISIKMGIRNILDSEYKETYRFNGKEYDYYSYKKGLSYSLGLQYSL